MGALLEAIEADTVLLDECDVVVPTNKIAEFLTYTKSLEAEADFRVKSFGHAGDGNLHIYTCSNDMEEGEFKKQVAVFMDKVYAKSNRIRWNDLWRTWNRTWKDGLPSRVSRTSSDEDHGRCQRSL